MDTQKPGFCVCYIRKAKPYTFCSCVAKSLLFISMLEYTITMYDTKSRELRWNATYSDYASTLPDDDTKYSETLRLSGSFLALFSDRPCL